LIGRQNLEMNGQNHGRYVGASCGTMERICGVDTETETENNRRFRLRQNLKDEVSCNKRVIRGAVIRYFARKLK
jgi:hypothetical protein